ncbi:MAG: hypothetical protein V9F02_11195 [Chitinophagaceae bacterium]
MKLKTSLFALLSVAALSANAQTIKAGLNFANITITNDGDVNKQNAHQFSRRFQRRCKNCTLNLFPRPGILITGKGSKTSSGNPSGSTYFQATSSHVVCRSASQFCI